MFKPKTFKRNLLDEPKDISSPEFFFSLGHSKLETGFSLVLFEKSNEA